MTRAGRRDAGPSSQPRDADIDWATWEKLGWVVADLPRQASLEDFCRRIGRVRPTRPDEPPVQVLKPTRLEDAPPRSLSAVHGLGAFPLHTDAAHHRVPPRLVVMRMASDIEGRSATLLLDLAQALRPLRQAAGTTTWLVHAGRHRFYANVLRRRSPQMFRVDFGCMRPLTAAGVALREALDQALDPANAYAFRWQADQVLVLDNWRVAHGREAVTGADDRVLERALLDMEESHDVGAG